MNPDIKDAAMWPVWIGLSLSDLVDHAETSVRFNLLQIFLLFVILS